MPRQKMYFEYELPTSVVEIVKAVCGDYERRERQIQHGVICGEVLNRYIEINNIIDKALEEIEAGIRAFILKDVQHKRGYDFSLAAPFVSKNTYYRRKRKLVYDIAKGLCLV